jgi:propanol-preferring alcohol dehydrogenase
MDYTKHLFGERTLRSTTASTRQDGEELLAVPGIETEITEFPFEQVNEGLLAIKKDEIQGSAVLQVAGC